jgi:TRAP-type C4-dicarboxylate transport system substrate-binding protein
MHDLPGLASTIDDKVVMFDIVRDRFSDILSERYNVKLLFMAPWPGTFVITRGEVPNVLDWSGQRIRASATPAQDQIIASGGDSFYMPGSELYTALEKGTIDGVITSIDWMIQMNFYEQVEYLYMLPFGIQFYFGVCNLDAFNDLSTAAQDVLVEEALRMESVLVAEAKKVNDEGVQTFRDNGVEVIFPSAAVLAEWQANVQMPLWDRAYPTWSRETQDLFKEIIDELDLEYVPPGS